MRLGVVAEIHETSTQSLHDVHFGMLPVTTDHIPSIVQLLLWLLLLLLLNLSIIAASTVVFLVSGSCVGVELRVVAQPNVEGWRCT